MLWLRRAAAALLAAEPEPEAAPLAAAAEPEEAPAAAPEQEPAPTLLGPLAPEQWASEEDLRRARDAGASARVRLLGARALPRVSTVTRRGVKVVFVVLRGSAAAQRPQAVYYGPWASVQHAVCTAAGNIDSGSVFHGFRTTSEAAAYWQEAVGDQPWPVGLPVEAAGAPARA
jgi:hypothetical protein